MIWSVLVGSALAADWSQTIDAVIPSVVVLRWEQPRAFDGERMGAPQASGFIVDAERGLILTNRHVVGTGPQIAHALFPNQEEVRIEPLYSDPIHDFGFYRYDPSELRQNHPSTLRLDPEGARVGTEIRLVGNDAGEQISILDGTLSRVDRPAPWWDMNTFYVQAASDSSGGSSGSPVFDIEGDVIALNAGGRRSESTSYYLRLERVAVALEHLQRGERPPRGTVMTRFAYRPYDELKRLGLSDGAEDAARAAWNGTGLLTVETVGKAGPAEGVLQPGDIVLEVGGRPVYAFDTLESRFDDAVGQSLSIVVERGGERLTVDVPVLDLHSTTPDRFLRFADGIFHEVGYWATMRNDRPWEGVVVARAGEIFGAAGVPTDSLIEQVGDTPIDDLETLRDALAGLAIGQVATVRYSPLKRPNEHKVTRIRMERTLFPDEWCAKADWTWACSPLEHPSEVLLPDPTEVHHHEVADKKARDVARRLVSVSSQSELPLNSSAATYWSSVGLLVDAEQGLVLTDRYGVPNEGARVFVAAGDSPRVPAEIVRLDPLYNAALVRFDPALLDFGELEPLEWAEDDPEQDGRYIAAMVDTDGQTYTEARTFSRFDELSLSSTAYPKFRADNLLRHHYGSLERAVRGGVVVDRKGRVVSLYQRFNNEKKGKPQPVVLAVPTGPSRALLAGQIPRYTGLDLKRTPLARAREAGVPKEVVERVRAHRPFDPVIMEVWRVDATVPSEVQVGDFVVAVDGATVATFDEVLGARGPSSQLTVVRNGVELVVEASSVDLSERSADRAVLWSGAWVQEEHLEVARETGTRPAGVYLSWYYGGSPAQRYNLGYGRRVLAIDGQPVGDLDAFLAAVADIPDGASVRVRLQSLKGRESTITLRTDLTWWPTLIAERTPQGWRRAE